MADRRLGPPPLPTTWSIISWSSLALLLSSSYLFSDDEAEDDVEFGLDLVAGGSASWLPILRPDTRSILLRIPCNAMLRALSSVIVYLCVSKASVDAVCWYSAF